MHKAHNDNSDIHWLPREAMEVVESLSMKVFKKMAGVALRDIVLWA